MTLKIATLTPDGSNWLREMRRGAEDIAQQTENRVKFKFYPGGVMGEDSDVIRKMRVGQLHGGTFTNGSLNRIYPDVQIYNLVLKFQSLEEIDYVRGYMDKSIIEGLEKNGLITFGFSEIGFAYLMSKEPIRTIDDLKNQKTWVPEGNNIALQAIKAFSISPIPLPIRDVLVSLQTGMIDTLAASPIASIVLHWHTQVNYVTDLPLSYIYGILALDKKAFYRISPEDRIIVKKIMTGVIKEIDRQNRKDNLGALEALRDQGITFLRLGSETIQSLKPLIEESNNTLIKEGKLSSDMVNTLNEHLRHFRSTRISKND